MSKRKHDQAFERNLEGALLGAAPAESLSGDAKQRIANAVAERLTARATADALRPGSGRWTKHFVLTVAGLGAAAALVFAIFMPSLQRARVLSTETASLRSSSTDAAKQQRSGSPAGTVAGVTPARTTRDSASRYRAGVRLIPGAKYGGISNANAFARNLTGLIYPSAPYSEIDIRMGLVADFSRPFGTAGRSTENDQPQVAFGGRESAYALRSIDAHQIEQELIEVVNVQITAEQRLQIAALGYTVGSNLTADERRQFEALGYVSDSLEEFSSGAEPRTTFLTVPDVSPFVAADDEPLSTFAMDVDTASYTIARQHLLAGVLPPPVQVRVEEFVNYFDYGYEPPTEDAFSIHLEAAPSPFRAADGLHLLRVGLQARDVKPAEHKAAILTFVIDVSGSMHQKLPLVKQSLSLLVEQLETGDEVAIVKFSDNAEVVLEHTPISMRGQILAAIDALQSEGSTNAADGLKLGYGLADDALLDGAINRVVLCTDGIANTGAATDAHGIRALIRRHIDKGITMSCFGFGMFDSNDKLMERLADEGDGTYAYIDDIREAERVFIDNLVGTLQVVARDAKVQVEFNPAVVAEYRLLGYENRALAPEDFFDDSVDAGEVGSGHSVTALYELRLRDDAPLDGPAATVFVRYRDPDDGETHEVSQSIYIEDFAEDTTGASESFRWAAAVAEWAEVLRLSPYVRGTDLANITATLDNVSASWRDAAAEDFNEAATLAEKTARIFPAYWPDGVPERETLPEQE